MLVNDTIQLTFDRPESFVPVRWGSAHYVAVMKNKIGELNALQHASAKTWSRLTPLIEIVGPRKVPDAYRGETVSEWVKRIAAAVGHHPCFLDILRMRAGHPATTSADTSPVLSVIHAAARKRGLACVPVFRLDDGPTDIGLVRNAVLGGGRGVAIRYPLLSLALPDGKTLDTVIKEALAAVQVDFDGSDLLIDLGFLSEGQEVHTEDIAQAVDELVAIGEWRSVVLLGTSMPSMLGGAVAEGSVGELPRREWEVWSGLRRHPPQRLPTYGDYVIQHPHPPQDDTGGGPSMRANIRYTVENMTLVARGRGPVGQGGKEQYHDLCRMLVARPEFAGRDFSWGDEQIADCAIGAVEPGSQSQWRGVGSSHHLRQATEQVSG
jgi:hypothetical protein